MEHVKKWKRFLSGALLCLLFSGAYGQTITVKGLVKDAKSGDPAPSANVFSRADQTGGLTDGNGYFEFKVQKKDTIRLFVTYSDVEESFILIPEPGQSVITDTLIFGKSVFEQETVIISASRKEELSTEATVSNIVVETKRIDMQASAEIQDAIENVPGVTIIDDQINIRGSSGYAYGVGSRVILALNGLPLLTADAGYAQFDLIPVDNIKQIEVVKGASSVLFGSSALGGVINVITDDPGEQPFTSVRLRGSLFDRPALKAADWDDNSNANIFSAHVFHARRIKDNFDLTAQVDLIRDSGYRKGEEKEEYRLKLFTNYRVPKVKGLTIGVNAAITVDSSGSFLWWRGYDPDTLYREIVQMNISPATGDTTYTSYMDTLYQSGALEPADGTLRKQLNIKANIDPTISYLSPNGNLFTYKGRYMITDNRNDTDQESTNQLIFNDFQFTTEFLKGNKKITPTLVLGGNYVYTDIKSDSLFGNHSGTQTAVFGQMNTSFTWGKPEQEIFNKLNTTFGVRYQRNTVDTIDVSRLTNEDPLVVGRLLSDDGDGSIDGALLFSVGLNLTAWRGANIRASYGEAFRSPSVAERFTNSNAGGIPIIPNPGIRDETGFSAEVGIHQGFRSASKIWKGYADVAAFVMEYNDMIEFGVVTDPILGIGLGPRNVSRAQIRGVEVTGLLEGRIGQFPVSFTGGYTYMDPKDLNYNPDSTYDATDPNTFSFPDRPEFLKYRTRHLARTSLSVGYKNFVLTWNTRHNSEIESVDQILYFFIPGVWSFRETHRGGNTIMDFILAYNWKNSRLSFHVFNATNHEYMIFPGRIAEQRKYSLQYKITF